MPRNTSNKYVNIFGKYLHFYHLMDVWMIFSRRMKTTGQRWYATGGKHSGSGIGWRNCWAGRGRMPRPWSRYTWRWFSQSCCTGLRHWLWHCALGGYWEDFTTGCVSDWQGGIIREGGTECGYTPRWRTRWRKRDITRWIPTYPATITWSHGSLQPGPLCTCVWRRSWDWGQGYQSGSGNRMWWMLKGCGRRLRGPNGWRGRRRRTIQRRRHIKLVRR